MGEISFAAWEESVPDLIKGDQVWKSAPYPKSLYLYDLAWLDCQKLWSMPLGRPLADQLLRSVGSISANLEEGFGRGVQYKEYDQFLRYSLGSAREAKGWYFRSRRILSDDLANCRVTLLDEVISLITSILSRRRQHV